ncbi:MAG: hypothetical protein WDA20_14305 [Desulfuromonadales bacterium]|jgi:hypothetical protein
MVLFYDPKDENDLARVERLLHDGGVEYFLAEEPEKEIGAKQVHVAEEDLPTAEALITDDLKRKKAESSIVLPGGS